MKTKKVLQLWIGTFCMLWMALAMSQCDVKAEAMLTLTADKTSAMIGETVNVTVQTSEPEDPSIPPEVSVTYNSDIFEFAGCNVEFGGGGGLVTFTGQSATITFKTLQTGAVSVGAEAEIDDELVTGNTMVTVVASVGAGLSSDATLYVVEMDPGELVPAFSSNVTEYQIVIGNDVTDISVSGAVSDPGAQIIAASGFKNLKEGTNQAVITVTAADGTMLTYHFTIVRGETKAEEEAVEETEAQEEETQSEQVSDGLNVTIDEAQYTVQSVIPEEVVPAGCTKTTSNFNGKPVEAVLFEKGGLTLLYALPAGSDSGDFFVYNEATGKLQYFAQIYNIENRYIVPIEAQDTPPAQFKAGKMQWNNFTLPAFVLEDRSIEKAEVFYLLYAVSNEGERGFYLYDSVEGTYQRFLNYTGAKAAAVATADGGFGKKAIIVIAVLAILLVGAIMLIVNMIIKNKEMQEDALFERKAKPKKVKEYKMPVKKQEPKPELKTESLEESKPEPKPVKKKVEPKPEVKKVVVPQLHSEPIEKIERKIVEKPVEKKSEAPQPVEVGKPAPTIRPTRPMIHADYVVTMKPRPVEKVSGDTDEIPITVVPTPKSQVQKPSVPIFTLEKPSDLDDDFEFEFINIDND